MTQDTAGADAVSAVDEVQVITATPPPTSGSWYPDNSLSALAHDADASTIGGALTTGLSKTIVASGTLSGGAVTVTFQTGADEAAVTASSLDLATTNNYGLSVT
jgi:hypothetical protein